MPKTIPKIRLIKRPIWQKSEGIIPLRRKEFSLLLTGKGVVDLSAKSN
jgi:hypothetical protein